MGVLRGFCESCCDHVRADETFNSFWSECGDGLIGVEEIDEDEARDELDDDDESEGWW